MVANKICPVAPIPSYFRGWTLQSRGKDGKDLQTVGSWGHRLVTRTPKKEPRFATALT